MALGEREIRGIVQRNVMTRRPLRLAVSPANKDRLDLGDRGGPSTSLGMTGRLLLRDRLLLAGHRALGTLAGARVGLGTLTADRQRAAVTLPAIATDVGEALDVAGDVPA